MANVIIKCLLAVGRNGYFMVVFIVTVKFQNYQCLGCTGFQTLQKIAPTVLAQLNPSSLVSFSQFYLR